MSLRVTCCCGKSFRAPPTLAGKRVKCPACGSPIAIPFENETALNAELVPLAANDPLASDPLAAGSAHDPLGLGNFDERTIAASPPRPVRTHAPMHPQTQPKQSNNQALTIGLIVGGFLFGGLLLMGILVALLLPAVQAAREAARRVQEENARQGIVVQQGPPLSTNPNSSNSNSLVVHTEIPPIDKWITYDSPEGYSILLPFQPLTITQTEQGMPTTISACDFGPKGQYMVVVSRIGRENALQALEGSIGIAGPVEGDVQTENKIELNGHPGREVNLMRSVAGVQMNIQARYYAVDDALYQIAFIGLGQPGVSVPEFLSSFKLTK